MIKSNVKKLFIRPISAFLRMEASSGIILAVCAAVAMLIANNTLFKIYTHILHFKILNLSIQHWINDGLMAIFFFVIGLEIKKEILVGELSTLKKAALPIAAALGGMVLPALIYAYFNPSQPTLNGWGIPMATDIAFALGVLTLFGSRVPLSLKIFLLALAIVDDLGAVLVIAFFYTSEIRVTGLILAGVVCLLIFALRFFHVRRYFIFILLGTIAWAGTYYSGVHSTIAGVVLGLLTPLSYPTAKGSLATYSPLEDLIHVLHPWVSYLIMPIFALANAGINLSGINFDDVYNHPVHQGILWGLFIGKPAGIFICSVIASWLGLAVLPLDLKWRHILGTAFLGGVGFTMALFISALSLASNLEVYSKTGILLGSIIAAVFGAIILSLTLKPPTMDLGKLN